MQTTLQNRSSFSSLVVSIHDVSTVTRKVVEKMLSDLAEVGVCKTSLLIIPDHHCRGRIDTDPEFARWLSEKILQGHEAVLHGFYHLRPSKSNEGVATKLITRSYTAGEGEFYDLSFHEAMALLREGREALKKCGISPKGFIAPAWLLGAEAERAVRELGFDYTTRIGTVIDFHTATTHSARSMVYSVRAGWRRAMSLAWNELLFRSLRKSPLLRIGLHPPDWEHESIRRHILKYIALAVAERKVLSYQEWIAYQRNVVLDQTHSSVH